MNLNEFWMNLVTRYLVYFGKRIWPNLNAFQRILDEFARTWTNSAFWMNLDECARSSSSKIRWNSWRFIKLRSGSSNFIHKSFKFVQIHPISAPTHPSPLQIRDCYNLRARFSDNSSGHFYSGIKPNAKIRSNSCKIRPTSFTSVHNSLKFVQNSFRLAQLR